MQQKDYLHEFYHKFCEPDDYLGVFKQRDFITRKISENQHVKMEICYLNAWKTFRTQTDNLIPYMRELVKKDTDNVES